MGKYYHCIQKIPYIVQMFIILLRNWILGNSIQIDKITGHA